MRLIVPYIGDMQLQDLRIVELAEFLGIPWQKLALDKAMGEKSVIQEHDCLFINPRVLENSFEKTGIPIQDISALCLGYSKLLVYGLRSCAFDSALAKALSGGRLQSIEPVNDGSPYTCSKDAREFCGPFAGLTFGRADSNNDSVFGSIGDHDSVEPLITIEGKPFAALVKEKRTTAVFIAAEELAHLDTAVGETSLAEYFSRFVSCAMALRYLAGDDCWRPVGAHASVVIDDPLLRRRYGFLNLRSLLHMAEKYNFHAAIAFIPHNFRRSSAGTVRLFRENPERLSICFHGNDHTQAELASADREFLNLLLRVATKRMALHKKRTALECDPVMVFPQGNFSVQAMAALQAHNFYAAVNTVSHPTNCPISLTLREIAQPAVVRYGNFPLFLRKSVDEMSSEDIASNVFFGLPVLIVMHHQDFEHEESLIRLVERITTLVPEIQWSSLANVTSKSLLCRRAPNGLHEFRAYAGSVRIPAAAADRYCSVEWSGSTSTSAVKRLVVDGQPGVFECADGTLRTKLRASAGDSVTLSVLCDPGDSGGKRFNLQWKAKAFLRRRLSEFRDNYLYKNDGMLQAARAVQRRVSKA